MNSTTPFGLALLIGLFILVIAVVWVLERRQDRRHEAVQDFLERPAAFNIRQPRPKLTQQPCPRCSTDGILYFHTPEVCEQDWQRREIGARINLVDEPVND